ncbi:hypothetical protein [Brevundimonas sp.]|uniref:hypothetical protein n=1 Tax=Brevundimonas sp. TaxID=1871086 RepID=UPI001AD330A2|nr:hypothetical protein [Brevundimonas sp.]MBN9467044.1 hypothetical protein [Brevundimonas sp.]
MFMPLALLALVSNLQSDPTTLADVVVEAHRIDPLLTVAVSGEVTQNAIVRSDPVGVRCGLTRFQYDAYEAPRLCWIRTPAGASIRLRAENAGASNWRVEWRGCEASADGAECVLAMPSDGAQVEARFITR